MKKISHSHNNHTFDYTIRHTADQSIWNEIFVYHEYRSVYDIVAYAKNPIIDIGAHVGYFTLLCRGLNDTAPIYAIEPSPENNDLLEQHIRENKLTNITQIRSALFALSGSQHLSLDPDGVWNKIVEKNGPTTVSVPTITLQDVCAQYGIEKISLLKLDIEWSEYKILMHMPSTMWSCIEHIFLEYHTDPAQEYANHEYLSNLMREHGFSVEHFPSKFDKKLGFLLARNKRMKKI